MSSDQIKVGMEVWFCSDDEEGCIVKRGKVVWEELAEYDKAGVAIHNGVYELEGSEIYHTEDACRAAVAAELLKKAAKILKLYPDNPPPEPTRKIKT